MVNSSLAYCLMLCNYIVHIMEKNGTLTQKCDAFFGGKQRGKKNFEEGCSLSGFLRMGTEAIKLTIPAPLLPHFYFLKREGGKSDEK